MPAGAGSGTLAYTPESSFLGGPTGTPTYYAFGDNESVEGPEFSNTLTDIFDPGAPETTTAVAENFAGAWAVTYILKNDEYHRMVFNAASNDAFVTGAAPSFELYFGLDYLSGTVERVAQGAIITRCTIVFQQGQEVEVQLRGVYGKEKKNTSITPGTIQDSGTPAASNTTSITVEGTTVADPQRATLEIGPLYEFVRDESRFPTNAVLMQPTPRLSFEREYGGETFLEQALGGSGVSTAQDTVPDLTGTHRLDFTTPGGTTLASYTPTTLTPTDYTWNNFVNPQETITDEIAFHVHGLTASAP